jgi:hypothetical protein
MIARALFLVLAVALSVPAAAAEKSVPQKAASPKAGVAKTRAATPADAKKPAAAPAATPAQLMAVMRAKRTFRYAADSCARPEKCDATLRDEAKSRFMDTCTACASDAVCEQERDEILGGTSKGSRNPCAP